jgi:hypothetical protein
MEMDANTQPVNIIREYMKQRGTPVKLVLVSDGPCKEIKEKVMNNWNK